jgi:hypothetical protein
MSGKLVSAATISALAAACACLWLGASVPGSKSATGSSSIVGTRLAASLAEESERADEPGIKTDRRIYRKPPLPALPRAGGTFRDPVFGTEIMRVTDESECPAPGCGTYYPHWPTFNVDNTRLLVRQGESGNAFVKTFDAANFSVGAGHTQLPIEYPRGFTLSWESSIWSHTDPDVIYTFSNDFKGGMRLYAYNVASKSFKLVKDFGSISRGPDFLHQMNMSADDDVFSWSHMRVGRDGVPLAYLVYRRSTDKILFDVPNTMDFNEVHVDKTGHWLNIPLNESQPDGDSMEFLNLDTGEVTKILDGAPDFRPGHGDLGTNSIVGFDNDTDGITWRHMSTPHVFRRVFWFRTGLGANGGVEDWTQDFHGTMLADNEDWLTVGTYTALEVKLPSTGIFADEIFQVALDGSQRIRRICHTRCSIDNKGAAASYWAMPKPTISRDGRFIAYTSNWEKSGRYDLFIAKIDPAPRLADAQPAPTPSPKMQRPRRVGRGH